MAQLTKQQHISATLFLNGTAYLTTQLSFAKDPREESEASGAAAEMLEDLFDVGGGVLDLPTTTELETLHARLGDKPVRVLSARKVKAHTLEDIARNLIGKKVTNIETEHEVTVLGIEGKNLIVQDGQTIVYEQALSNFSYEFEDADQKDGSVRNPLDDFRSRDGVEVEFAGLPVEGGDVRLGFLASGLSVTPHYNIVLAGNTLSLQPLAKVENETGTSFEEILLTVVVSEVGRPYFQRSYRGDGGVNALLACGAGGFGGGPGGTDSGEVVEESGLIGYRLGIRNIPQGESLLELPGEAAVDGYRIVHRVNLSGHRQADVRTSLTFVAPRNLPTGAVAVYSQVEQGSVVQDHYEGGGSLASTLSGKEATIGLRTPDTLKVKIEQVGEARFEKVEGGDTDNPLYALFRKYEVTVSNGGDQDITVETYLHLNEMQQLWGEEGHVSQKVQRHVSSTAHKLRWDITAPAQGEEKHTYTVREKLLRPLNRDELRAFAESHGIPPLKEDEATDPEAADDVPADGEGDETPKDPGWGG